MGDQVVGGMGVGGGGGWKRIGHGRCCCLLELVFDVVVENSRRIIHVYNVVIGLEGK